MVTMSVYDSNGTLIFTEVRNDPGDDYDLDYGGNRYGWFTNIDVAGGIAVDDVQLFTESADPVQVFSGSTIVGDFATIDAAKAAIDGGSITGAVLRIQTTGLDDSFFYVATTMSIQDAIDAAAAGDTVVVADGAYNESLSITKALELIGDDNGGDGVPDVFLTPTGANGIDLSGDIDNGGSETVSISGIAIDGGSIGIRISSSTVLSSLAISNSSFSNHNTHGIGSGSGAFDLGSISIVNSTFTDNGQGGSNGTGDIVLFGFVGDATLQDIVITQNTTSGTAVAARGDNAIQITGRDPVTYDVLGPIGTVVFDNVSVDGWYHKPQVLIQGYTDFNGLSLTDVDLSGGTSWGDLLFIDPIGSSGQDAPGNAGYPGNFPLTGGTSDLDLSGVTISSGSTGVLGVDSRVRGTDADDNITGTNGNDLLNDRAETDFDYGGNDNVSGLGGDDFLWGGLDDDTLDGGADFDTAIFAGSSADYSYTTVKDANGFVIGFTSVTDNNGGDGDEGTDALTSIEALLFLGDGFTLSITNPVQVFDGSDNFVGSYATIQEAVDAAANGYTIRVAPGTYNESVVIDVSITLISTGGRDVTTIMGVDNGELGAIEIDSNVDDVTIGAVGAGFTIVGLNGNGAIEKAAIYLQGNHDNIVIEGNDVVANGDHGLLSEFSAAVTNITINQNIFSGQTFTGAQPGGIGFSTQFNVGNNVPRQLVVLGNGNNPSPSSNNIFFTNNELTGTTGGISSDDNVSEQGNTMVTIDAANSVISNNNFSGETARFATGLRARGPNTDIENNTFDNTGGGDTRGVFVNNHGSPGSYTGNVFTGGGDADLFFGSPGDDSMTGSSDNDTLVGDLGADMLNGGDGDDSVFGGDGDDWIVGGSGLGDDTLDGGGDTDMVSYTSASAGVVVDLGGGSASGAQVGTDVLIDIENVMSGAGADDLTGTGGANHMVSGAGDDTVEGGGGNDYMNGGDDIDTARYLGALADYNIVRNDLTGVITVTDLRGGSPDGTDTLVGFEFGAFSDGTVDLLEITNDGPTAAPDDLVTDEDTALNGNLLADNGNGADSDPDDNMLTIDRVNGSALNVGATIVLTSGASLTVNADGTFTYDASVGLETLNDGEVYNDVFNYRITDAYGATSTASVFVTVNGVTPVTVGTPNDDVLLGSDLLTERIEALAGDDSVRGGDRNDTLIGDAGDDTLKGDNGDDALFGGFGADRVEGGGGDDFVRTGPDNDTLIGGDGDDTLGASNRTDLLRGGGGDDLLLGSNGNDRLFGDDDSDTLLGGNGRDTMEGGEGADRLVGNAGTDTASYANAGASVAASLEAGGGSAGDASGDTFVEMENLFGSAFADTLIGDGGVNRIDGGDGDDFMNGKGGNDILVGGAGNDTLVGDTGNDRFWFFGADAGDDRIADFVAGAGTADTIRLIGFGASFDTFAEILAASSQVGADTVIDFGGGRTITLAGVNVGDLHGDDFIFG